LCAQHSTVARKAAATLIGLISSHTPEQLFNAISAAAGGSMLFTGDSRVRRLGAGSSRAEAESRERLLERTRREREQRAQERLRARAATTIQVGA
jgi:hypothetical protein